jgi:enterochelin esterase-like enzyme
MKFKVFFILIVLIVLFSNAQTQVSSGKLDVYKDFSSKYVTARTIEVWLPDNYNFNTKYAVLQMHDGQMLFDEKTTWNKQSWNVDETAIKLIQNKITKPFIVVGIYNDGKNRHADYFPQKPFEKLSSNEKELVSKQLKVNGRTIEDFKPNFDNYLKFLVHELKPKIDKTYHVAPDKNNTFIRHVFTFANKSRYNYKKNNYKNKNYQTRFFEGQDHCEIAWSSRLQNPLNFLLK